MAEQTTKSRCLIHFDGKRGPLTPFTDVSFKKFLLFREQWVALDGEQKEVAEKSFSVVKDAEIPTNPENLYYHRECYSKFTNKSLVTHAKRRCEKNEGFDKISNIANETLPSTNDKTQVPEKFLRSSTNETVRVKPRNPHVLPPTCIICGKENHYITDSVRIYISSFIYRLFSMQISSN